MRNAISPSFLFLKEVFDGTEQYEMHRTLVQNSAADLCGIACS